MANQIEVLNITDLDALSSTADSDYIIVFDSANSVYKRISRDNLRLDFSGDFVTAYDRSVIGVSGSGNGTITINQESGSVSGDLSHDHSVIEGGTV